MDAVEWSTSVYAAAVAIAKNAESREELVRTLDALESALAGRLAAGGEPRRLIRAVDLVRQLRAAARLNAAPGQLAGWLCAGMF